MIRKNFYEVSIAPEDLKGQKALFVTFKILKILFIAICITSFVVAFSFIKFFWIIFAVSLLVVIFFAFLQYKFYCFYDYSYIDGSVRISRILNNKRALPYVNFECSKVISVGNVNSKFFVANKHSKEYKVYVAKSGKISQLDTVFFVQGQTEKRMIVLSYQQQLLGYIFKTVPVQKIDKDYLNLIKQG